MTASDSAAQDPQAHDGTTADAPRPTGERTPTGIAIPRRLDGDVEDTWAWLTDPDRTAQWFGCGSGDPASGEVQVQLAAEEGAPMSTSTIHACEAPHRLVLGTGPGWVVTLTVEEAGGADGEDAGILTLSQDMDDPEFAAMVGPGWEFYLDRLEAARAGGDVDAIAFEPGCVPGQSDHYRGHFA
ncbi:SRPBCC domain-containing protein [Brachybacterium huguangmaarense]